MHRVLQQVNLCLEQFPNGTYLLALSGGVDSTALFHALRMLGVDFACARIKYQLREEESERDAQFVQDLCHSHKIRLFYKVHPLTNRESNIQAEARLARYNYFEYIRSKHHLSAVLTAHHMDDRIETFLLNLSRGAGLKGLSSLASKRGVLVRPLINCTKDEIEDFANLNNIKWMEDSSNLETMYHRNLLRHEAIPAFRKINPEFTRNAARSIQIIESAKNLLNQYRLLWESQYVQKKEDLITLTVLNTAEDYFLFEYLSEIGFHHSTLSQIRQNLMNPGKEFRSDSGWSAFIDRSKILLTNNRQEDKVFNEELIIEHQTLLLCKNTMISLREHSLVEVQKEYKSSPPNIIYIDLDKIRFPLKLRAWNDGDFIRPLGMNGRKKKVQDILTDFKIPRLQKSKCLVLISGNEIIWLVNFCLAESVKITAQTERILKLTYEDWDDAKNKIDEEDL